MGEGVGLQMKLEEVVEEGVGRWSQQVSPENKKKINNYKETMTFLTYKLLNNVTMIFLIR